MMYTNDYINMRKERKKNREMTIQEIVDKIADFRIYDSELRQLVDELCVRALALEEEIGC